LVKTKVYISFEVVTEVLVVTLYTVLMWRMFTTPEQLVGGNKFTDDRHNCDTIPDNTEHGLLSTGNRNVHLWIGKISQFGGGYRREKWDKSSNIQINQPTRCISLSDL